MGRGKNSLKICTSLMVFIFIVVLLCGCQQVKPAAEDGDSKLQVAVTIYPLAEFARG